MTTIAIMQPYFYPYAGYFRLFSRADLFVIYDCVQFPRRGWVHRNRLTAADGSLQWLTLRLAYAPQETAIRDMRLEAGAMTQLTEDLQRFPTLAGAPPADLAALPLLVGTGDLVDYLASNLQTALDRLSIQCPMRRSSELAIDPSLRGQARILAIARELGATRYLNSPGGRDLYDERAFREAGIKLEFLEPSAGASSSMLERLLAEAPETIRADAW